MLHELAEGALLVEYPGLLDEDANARAVADAQALERADLQGLRAAIVGARTLFLEFDPDTAAPDRLRSVLDQSGPSEAPSPRRVFRLPVVYGGSAGVDLPDLAHQTNLAPEEFARRHAAAVYRVAFLGFAPGFAYLTGLPAELQAPRLSTPRPRVARGTVAIAGPYAGVYPGQTPGGWRLIGWTSADLFDPDADPPTLLLPGDEVRFVPVDLEGPRPAEDRARNRSSKFEGTVRLRLVAPGVLSSVQGAPRYEGCRFGIPPGGAMDPVSLVRANSVLGNDSRAPGLEMTLVGAEVEALDDTTIVLSGAEADADCNGTAVKLGQRIRLRIGDHLRVGRIRGGVRTYLAVEGGLAPPARFEVSPRLAAGDLLSSAPPPVSTSPRPPVSSATSPWAGSSVPADHGLFASETIVVRVVLDPREGPFSKEGIAAFLSSTYRVSPSSDRRGIRLEGEPISLARDTDIAPEGTPLGGIQVPRDGQPIVLGPDRPVTGGYARIGTVVRADFPLLSQRPSGAKVRFHAVDLADARAARVG